MSAMLETYDMQMLDYSADTDVSMHPSSSDQWFPDEAKMEEDVPLKADNFGQSQMDGHLPMKTDFYAHDRGDVTIEIDMEPLIEPQNVEYEMGDDENLHDTEVDVLDVEVYDVSAAVSPFMHPVEPNQVEHPVVLEPSDKSEGPVHMNKDITPKPHSPTLELLATDHVPPTHEAVTSYEFGNDTTLPETDVPPGSEPAVSSTIEPEAEGGQHRIDSYSLDANHDGSRPEDPDVTREALASSKYSRLAGQLEAEAVSASSPPGNTSENEGPHRKVAEQDPADHASAQSSGDPHEISEGVYIDPPPPVLLAVASDNVFGFTLFNDLSDWSSTSTNSQVKHVLLQHLPTLYYEPLSTVFESLRQEQLVQSKFNLADSELILDVTDLSLPISEDNLYAREVTLHDLNVLHDAYGISGPLRVKLHGVAPRFVTRYQYLQDHIGQLPLGQPSNDATSVVDGLEDEQGKPMESWATNLDLPHNGSETTELTAFAHPHDGAEARPAANDFDSSEATVNQSTFEGPEHLEDGAESTSQGNADEPGLAHSELDPLHAQGDESRLPRHVTDSQGSSGDTEEIQELVSTGGHEFDTSVIGLDVIEAKLSDQSPTGGEKGSKQSSGASPHSGENEDQVEAGEVVQEIEDSESKIEQIDHLAHDEVRPEWHEAYEEQDYEDYEDSEVHNYDEHGDEDKVVAQQDAEGAEPEELLDLAHLPDRAASEDTLDVEGDALDGVPEQDATTTGDGEYTYDTLRNDTTDEASYQPADQGQEQNDRDAVDPLVNEVPLEPVPFDGEVWDDDLDRGGDLEATWDEGNTAPASNQSSVTLSSKTSKRSFDEFESDEEEFDENGEWEAPSSPDPKRSRTQ